MSLEKQYSIFIQNKVGSLKEICTGLSKAKINIKALSIIDDMEWGIVRLVLDDNKKGPKVLQELGLMYGESQVVTVAIPNNPGALVEIATKLSKKKINIEQAYATATGEDSLLVMATTDNKKANQVLSS
jgi:hypothetical protein